MLAIENIVEEIANSLGLDPLEVRRVNFYQKEKNNTTKDQILKHSKIPAEITDEIKAYSK